MLAGPVERVTFHNPETAAGRISLGWFVEVDSWPDGEVAGLLPGVMQGRTAGDDDAGADAAESLLTKNSRMINTASS